MRLFSNRKIIIISFLIIVVDQIVKTLFIRWSYPVVLNQGVAFSFLSSSPQIAWILTTVLLSILAVIALVPKGNTDFHLSIGMIFGGGLSNYFDRTFRGGIVDFMSMGAGPLFNIADVAIFLGVVTALFTVLRKKSLLRRL